MALRRLDQLLPVGDWGYRRPTYRALRGEGGWETRAASVKRRKLTGPSQYERFELYALMGPPLRGGKIIGRHHRRHGARVSSNAGWKEVAAFRGDGSMRNCTDRCNL